MQWYVTACLTADATTQACRAQVYHPHEMKYEARRFHGYCTCTMLMMRCQIVGDKASFEVIRSILGPSITNVRTRSSAPQPFYGDAINFARVGVLESSDLNSLDKSIHAKRWLAKTGPENMLI